MFKHEAGSRASIGSQADACALSGESAGYGKLRVLFQQKFSAKKCPQK
jgi:hypothetical protein